MVKDQAQNSIEKSIVYNGQTGYVTIVSMLILPLFKVPEEKVERQLGM